MTGVAKGTILTLLRNVGAHCKNHHDRIVQNVPAKRVQLDELWAFVGMKKKRATEEKKAQGFGDVWTFYALDQDSKLVIAYRVGTRSIDHTMAFCQDLADRLANRVQVTSDGMKFYRPAMETAFGWWGADFAQLHKIYAHDWDEEKGRYSPPTCIGAEKHVYMGDPKDEDICTSHVERMNLTTRMLNRRFTRLTNGHSKKVENHMYSVALHVMWVNFCRPSMALSRGKNKVTPAMAAGLADRVWVAEDILNLLQTD